MKTLRHHDEIKDKEHEILRGLGGPMTRARAKKAKEALQQIVATILDSNEEEMAPKWIIIAQAQDEDAAPFHA